MPDFETNPIAVYVNDPANVIPSAVFTPTQPEGAPQTTIRGELQRLDASAQEQKEAPDDADFFALNDSLTPQGRGIKQLTWARMKAAIIAQIGNFLVPTGSIHCFYATVAPVGYLKLNGTSIGSAASGATGRANSDVRALYRFVWPTVAASALQTSTGTATTKGASADADFDANKRIVLPDLRGEVVRGWDDGRGVDAGRAIGSSQLGGIESHTHTGAADSGGSHTHTGTTDTQGSHTHTGVTDTQGVHSHALTGSYEDNQDNGPYVGTANQNPWGSFSTGNAGAHAHNLSINAAGAHSHNVTIATGGVHGHTLTINAVGGTETRMRNVALLYCIKF